MGNISQINFKEDVQNVKDSSAREDIAYVKNNYAKTSDVNSTFRRKDDSFSKTECNSNFSKVTFDSTKRSSVDFKVSAGNLIITLK